MKRIDAIDPVRQEMWGHNGHKYSVVDLRIPPKEANGERAGGRFIDLMHEMYYPYCFELADITGDIEVIGRYKSFAEAAKAIESGIITT